MATITNDNVWELLGEEENDKTIYYPETFLDGEDMVRENCADNYSANVSILCAEKEYVSNYGDDVTIISANHACILNEAARAIIFSDEYHSDYILNYGSNASISCSDGEHYIINHGSYVSIVSNSPCSIDSYRVTVLHSTYTPDYVTINCSGSYSTIYASGDFNLIQAGENGSGDGYLYVSGADATISGNSDTVWIYNNENDTGYKAERTLILYAEQNGDKLIRGFHETSTLSITSGSFETLISDDNGDDILCVVGNSTITLEGAASVSPLNILGSTVDTVNTEDTVNTVSENFNGLQGFEIQIAEQQITETVTFTAASPFEIMQQTTGQFLDYKYNLRIESITQRGILYTCRCCTNLEEILYSQLEYSVPEVSRQQRTWHWVGGHKTYDEPERANASGHVEAIAGALGISYKNQFDDFVSTVEVERGGSTYADTIRELFGWSARIPTLLINAFIRDDCLYVIQRGHEERVIDISNAKITLPIFTRELVRTYWGETTYINTEVRTVSCIVNSFQESDYENDGTDTGGAGMFTIREPSAPLRQHENTKTATGSIEKSYHYNENGLLVKTIETTKNTEEETTGQTITVYEYEGDGDYLKEETMTIYDKTGAITEKRTITYSPTGAGQASAVGKNSDGETFLNTIKDIPPSEMPTPYALNKNFHDLQEADPEFQAQKQARQQERLVPGIVPFDTSFPIVGDDKLIEITNAIKDLNRRTKETVTLTLYDYEHLIDFNDRILLYGAEYFLVSNTLTTTPHVRDQQSLVLVRWY